MSLLLREKRTSTGKTLNEMAAICGLSASQLSRIERGLFGRLDFQDAAAICDAYDVDLETLHELRRAQ